MRVIAARRRFVRRRFFIRAADLVLLGSPGAEVDLLAALGTEWAEAVFRCPADVLSAGWAFDDSGHTVRRSIENRGKSKYGGGFSRFKGPVLHDLLRLTSQAAQRQLKGHINVDCARPQIPILNGESHPQHVLVGARFRDHPQFGYHTHLHELIRPAG